MSEIIMRELIHEMNHAYKEKIVKDIDRRNKIIIDNLSNLSGEIQKLRPFKKWVILQHVMPVLFLNNDNGVISLLKSFGIVKYTPKFFTPINNFFEELDKYQQKSKFVLRYEVIWICYHGYAKEFFRKQLFYDLGLNLNKMLVKASRDEKRVGLHPILEELYDASKKVKDFVKNEAPEIRSTIFDESLGKSVKKQINFPHKVELYNLYQLSLYWNKEAKLIEIHEPDFKYDFHDLLEIVIIDRDILNETHDTLATYKTERREKIKRVERLILS